MSRTFKNLIALFVISFIYLLVLGMGLQHYINFIPSFGWKAFSLISSLTLGLAIAVYAKPYMYRPEPLKKLIGMAVVTWVSALPFYFVSAYGIGPVATSIFHTTLEKDIYGMKGYYDGYYQVDDYYVTTSDLVKNTPVKIYITRKEYKSGHKDVRMHLTLKKSFFGMAVERYTFLSENPNLKK